MADHSQDASPPPLEFYKLIRSQLEHEDSLVTNRISWFLTSQSFFFSAYAITSNGYISTPRPNLPMPPGHGATFTDPRLLLLWIVPTLSIVTCVLTGVGIFASIDALHRLRRIYLNSPLRGFDEHLPPVEGFRATNVTGMAAPALLPVIFMCVWLYLLQRRFF